MIKRVTITDFKSIRNLTMEFGPVTVLVGRSGTGKSNIVQALRFLRNYVFAGENAAAIEGGWHRIVPAGEGKPRLMLDVTFGIEGIDGEYRYSLILAGHPAHGTYSPQNALYVSEEKLSLADRVLFERCLTGGEWSWRTPPAVVGVPSPEGELAIRRLPAMQDVVYAYAALSSGIGYYSLPTTVLGRQ